MLVADRPVEERAALIERALRGGLTAIQSVGVTVNVDAEPFTRGTGVALMPEITG